MIEVVQFSKFVHTDEKPARTGRSGTPGGYGSVRMGPFLLHKPTEFQREQQVIAYNSQHDSALADAPQRRRAARYGR